MTKEKLVEQIKRWRVDPLSFVSKVFGVEPTKQQAEIIKAFAKPGSKVVVSSGHGVGKTSLMAWLAIWHTLLFSDSKAAATAPSATQLKDVLMSEVGKWVNKAHPWVKDQLEWSSMRLALKGKESTSFLTARTARKEDPSALQGLHAKNMAFFIDEAFGVPDTIYEVARGALSTPNARVILCGNPTQTTGYAHNAAFGKNKYLFDVFRLSCLDSPLVSDEYVEEMKQEYGEDSDIYRVRVLGLPPTASIMQLIPTPLVEAARKQRLHPSQYDFAPKILGVDVAWEGDDRSCIWMRQGLAAQLLFQGRNIDSIDLAGLVMQYEDMHKTNATFIDAGYGNGVIDQLRRLHRNPIAVWFGSGSRANECKNKRAEMWWNMLNWLKTTPQIPDRDDVQEDLIGVEKHHDLNGKIQLEKKTDMKKRGLCSPDLGDGLALTFAEPVVLPSVYAAYDRNHGKIKTDYDVLNR